MAHPRLSSPSRAVPLGAMLLLSACQVPLAPGDWGPFRYFANIRSEAPMRLLPPVSDRAGNIYVAHGSDDHTDTQVWVGHLDGGWSGPCQAHRGSDGVHGFVGRSHHRSWLWAGDGLFELDGESGACREVMQTDPVTGSELFWLGVVPHVVDRPSRETIVGLVQGTVDLQPSLVTVDLDRNMWTDVSTFPVPEAEDVFVLGVGADVVQHVGMFLLTWIQDGETVVEAWEVDKDGDLDLRVGLDPALATLTMDGFFRRWDGGAWLGLSTASELVIIDDGGASVQLVDSFEPAAVQVLDGTRFLAGTGDGTPVIATLGADGSLGDPLVWDSAVELALELSDGIQVKDERSAPWRNVAWPDAQSALGSHALVSSGALDDYVQGATGWLIAGPAYSTGVEPVTSVAFAPAGFSIP